MSFNPLNVVASFIASLQSGQRFELYDGDVAPLKGETPETAIRYSVSVGQGRGSSKVDLNGGDVPGVVAALYNFDPEEDLSHLSPVECIGRTIVRAKDGSTTFKLSLAKNARSVKVPAGEWNNFLEYMDTVQESIPLAVAHYQGLVAAAEESANKGK